MPEFTNIQAYLSLDRRSPEDALDMFRLLLQKQSLLTGDIEHWFKSLHWSAADDGLVYPSGQQWTTVRLAGATLEVAPHALGWTRTTIPGLKSNWLELGLLLKTEDISFSSPDDWRYRPELGAALYQLLLAFLPCSVDAPTFLTDEAQDGKPWETWIGSGDEPWAFDLAIVGDGVPWPVRAAPPAHFTERRFEGGKAIARNAIWSSLPWMPCSHG